MLTAKELVPSLDLEEARLVQRRAWLELRPLAEPPIDPRYPHPLPPPPALCPPDEAQTEGKGRGIRSLSEAGSFAARFTQTSCSSPVLVEATPQDELASNLQHLPKTSP